MKQIKKKRWECKQKKKVRMVDEADEEEDGE